MVLFLRGSQVTSGRCVGQSRDTDSRAGKDGSPPVYGLPMFTIWFFTGVKPGGGVILTGSGLWAVLVMRPLAGGVVCGGCSGGAPKHAAHKINPGRRRRRQHRRPSFPNRLRVSPATRMAPEAAASPPASSTSGQRVFRAFGVVRVNPRIANPEPQP